ncbi:hypothetical protein PR048_008391 [Dryococelus australis]|uniref:Uncharacterized protein n=1 Tax=Dryococelus australis TaxID=614101 RepID=A0ABQ9HWZ6_9NEOP|nr:hypothetical protein PR048_008391 [Dryococelus australis]
MHCLCFALRFLLFTARVLECGAARRVVPLPPLLQEKRKRDTIKQCCEVSDSIPGLGGAGNFEQSVSTRVVRRGGHPTAATSGLYCGSGAGSSTFSHVASDVTSGTRRGLRHSLRGRVVPTAVGSELHAHKRLAAGSPRHSRAREARAQKAIHGEPGSLPDFRMWKSCRTMPLDGGFSRRCIPALLHSHFAISHPSRGRSCLMTSHLHTSNCEDIGNSYHCEDSSYHQEECESAPCQNETTYKDIIESCLCHWTCTRLVCHPGITLSQLIPSFDLPARCLRCLSTRALQILMLVVCFLLQFIWKAFCPGWSGLAIIFPLWDSTVAIAGIGEKRRTLASWRGAGIALRRHLAS